MPNVVELVWFLLELQRGNAASKTPPYYSSTFLHPILLATSLDLSIIWHVTGSLQIRLVGASSRRDKSRAKRRGSLSKT